MRALEHLLEQAAQLGSRAAPTRPLPGGERQKHVLEHAVARLHLEHLLEEAREREPARRAPRGRLGDRDEVADAALEDGLDERVARREVAVERADADARAASDLLERRLDAALGEDLARRRDEQLVVAARVAPLSLPARRRCRSCATGYTYRRIASGFC